MEVAAPFAVVVLCHAAWLLSYWVLTGAAEPLYCEPEPDHDHAPLLDAQLSEPGSGSIFTYGWLLELWLIPER